MAEKLEKMGLTVCVAATTGMAATLIGGITLHRWGGIGLAKEPVKDLLRKMRRETRERWRETDVLIIDEVSMLDPEMFGKYDEIAQHLRSCRGGLFGGIQIIASGDFLQLPPVKPDGEHRFVFQHPAWEKGIDKTFVFKHIYRTTDALFTEVLSRVRTADHTTDDIEILKTRLHSRIPDAEALGILPTRMYSHRGDVDTYNRTQLDALEGEARSCTAVVKVRRTGAHHAAQRRYALNYSRAENQAAQACPVGRTIEYKDGAQVLCVVNLDQEAGLVNGSRGVVTDAHHPDGIEVLFLNGETRVIEPFPWKHDGMRGDKGEAITLEYRQIPLALAWAYTVRPFPPIPLVPTPPFHLLTYRHLLGTQVAGCHTRRGHHGPRTPSVRARYVLRQSQPRALARCAVATRDRSHRHPRRPPRQGLLRLHRGARHAQGVQRVGQQVRLPHSTRNTVAGARAAGAHQETQGVCGICGVGSVVGGYQGGRRGEETQREC